MGGSWANKRNDALLEICADRLMCFTQNYQKAHIDKTILLIEKKH